MKINQTGRSMIEMLGVLAIVGVLSVGGIAGYRKAINKYKIDKLISQFDEALVNIRSLYINQKDFSGININHLRNVGIFPDMTKNNNPSDSSVTHIFGGHIQVFTSRSINNEAGAFELYFSDLPSSACFALATLNWGIDVTSGFTGFYVGTETVTEAKMKDVLTNSDSHPEQGIYTAGIHENALPLSIPMATNACQCPQKTCTIGIKYQ